MSRIHPSYCEHGKCFDVGHDSFGQVIEECSRCLGPEQKIPCRQKCAACSQVLTIDYHVSDGIWYEAVKPFYNNSIICINCFARWADEKLLPWCQEITLRPCSMRIQIDMVNGLGENHYSWPHTHDPVLTPELIEQLATKEQRETK